MGNALNTVGNGIKGFFTETIPRTFNTVGSRIKDFHQVQQKALVHLSIQ